MDCSAAPARALANSGATWVRPPWSRHGERSRQRSGSTDTTWTRSSRQCLQHSGALVTGTASAWSAWRSRPEAFPEEPPRSCRSIALLAAELTINLVCEVLPLPGGIVSCPREGRLGRQARRHAGRIALTATWTLPCPAPPGGRTPLSLRTTPTRPAPVPARKLHSSSPAPRR